MITVHENERPIHYDCPNCIRSYTVKKCPRCGRICKPIYASDIDERPVNNPTDIDAFFKKQQAKHPPLPKTHEYVDYASIYTTKKKPEES